MISKNGGEKPSMKLAMSGAVDMTDVENLKTSFSVSVPIDEAEGTIAIDGISIDDVTYFQVKEIPALMPFDFSFLKKQWIRVDIDEIVDKYAGEADEKTLAEAREAMKGKELTEEQMARIRESFSKYRVFRVTDTLPKEDVEGKSALHYRYEIDKEELSKYVAEVVDVMMPGEELSAEEKADFEESFSELKSMGGEMWIYEGDMRLAKITLSIETAAADAEDENTEMTMSFTFRNYDKPVSIEAPAQSKSIDEVFAELLGGMLGGAGAGFDPAALSPEAGIKIPPSDATPALKGADAGIKSLLSGLRAQAELYYDNQSPMSYGTAYAAASCPSSGLSMFSIDRQIRNAIREAAAESGSGLEATRCASSGAEYAVSVRLSSKPGIAWCVDSMGQSKEISNLSWSGASCP